MEIAESSKQVKTLVLMRHAKSDWGNAGLTDHDRPLNARGRGAAAIMANYIDTMRFPIEAIRASSAIRVQETLEIMQSTWNRKITNFQVFTELYLAPSLTIAKNIAQVPDSIQSLMIVGHNPGLGSLVAQLSGQDVSFPTACLAVFETPSSSWKESFDRWDWQLIDFRRPKDCPVKNV